jgi:hypothetical protein
VFNGHVHSYASTFFEIFNQLNQIEVRRRRRCKRWVFAMESVARPLKP